MDAAFWGVAGEFLGSFLGVLGALLIFGLETRRVRAEERRRRDRELVGLLMLLYGEIAMNRELMKKYAENRVFLRLPERPSSDIWDEAKVRIVELAPPMLSGALNSYYRLLRGLRVQLDASPAESNDAAFVSYVKNLLQGSDGVEVYVEGTIAAYDKRYGDNLLEQVQDRPDRREMKSAESYLRKPD